MICSISLLVLLASIFLSIFKHSPDYSFYLDLAKISATLTVGFGAMSLSYHTILSRRQHTMMYKILESKSKSRLEETIKSHGLNPIEYEISKDEEGIAAFTDVTIILFGFFKLFFVLTCVFAVHAFLLTDLYSYIICSGVSSIISHCL